MSKREKKLEGAQKGQQQHAEGQHGPKAHQKFLENLHRSLDDEPDNVIRRDESGKHRLFERRKQHDEAELNSELTRREREDFDDAPPLGGKGG